MPDIISLLPNHVANQIAAGEVVQRPASVVKNFWKMPLMGATSIKLIIKDAGKTMIQVIDDGKGMTTTDSRLCFKASCHLQNQSRRLILDFKPKGFGERLWLVSLRFRKYVCTKNEK